MSRSLLLFEPFLWDDVADYPDLGSAMLVGACRAAGINVCLVPTQRELLEWLFIEHGSEQATRLKIALPREGARYAPKLSAMRKELGARGLCRRLQDYYQSFSTPSWANFLAGRTLEEGVSLFREMVALDSSFLFSGQTEGKPDSLILRFVLSRVSNFKADFIGLSFYRFGPLELRIAENVRKVVQCPVVLGGAATGHLSTDGVRMLQSRQCADYLILGPGEQSLPRLVLKTTMGLPQGGIPGVQNLQISAPIISPFSTTPSFGNLPFPDFSQAVLHHFPAPTPVLPMQTSRGCPWRKCSFCSHHKSYQNRYETLDMARLVESIRHYDTQYGCRHIVLHDEDVPPHRARKIAETLRNNDLRHVRLSCYARPVRGYVKEGFFEELRDGGFVSFSWGIESGSQRMLDRIKKGTRQRDIATILRRSHNAQIANVCWLMVGIPTETEKELKATLSLIRKTASYVDFWLVSRFRLQKDSPMANDPKPWGLLIPPSDDPLSYAHEVVSMAQLPNKGQVEQYEKEVEKLTQNSLDTSLFISPLPQTNRSRLIPFLLKAHRATFDLTSLDEPNRNKNIVLLGEIQEVHGKSYLRLATGGTVPLGIHRRLNLSPTGDLQWTGEARRSPLLQKLASERVLLILDESYRNKLY